MQVSPASKYRFTKSNRYPYLSPLRYPGGKAILYPFLRDLIDINLRSGSVYGEPYAGGAGAGLELLFNGHVDQIVLNDVDVHIYAFWNVLLNDSDWLIDRISRVKVTLTEWKRQRRVYEDYRSYGQREIAFSTFFLNRCNRGGILPKAGPIGGAEQKGNYLIDARFNKESLIRRITEISAKRDQISFENLDAADFIRKQFRHHRRDRLLLYIDPPYFVQGSSLYFDSYTPSNHADIAHLLKSKMHRHWVLSYDNAKPIVDLYKGMNTLYFNLQYSLQRVAVAKEIMVFSESVKVPTAVSRKFLS